MPVTFLLWLFARFVLPVLVVAALCGVLVFGLLARVKRPNAD